MAQFRVGQRVRIDYPGSTAHGKEGTIWYIGPVDWTNHAKATGLYGTGHRVSVDGLGELNSRGNRFCFMARDLRPLTDPGADAFMERIRKLGREPVNVTEKVEAK